MRWKRYDNCEAIDAQLWSMAWVRAISETDDHARVKYSLA